MIHFNSNEFGIEFEQVLFNLLDKRRDVWTQVNTSATNPDRVLKAIMTIEVGPETYQVLYDPVVPYVQVSNTNNFDRRYSFTRGQVEINRIGPVIDLVRSRLMDTIY